EEALADALGELAARRAAELLEARLEQPRVRALAQLRVAQAAAQARDAAGRDPRAEGGLAERLRRAVLVEEVLDLARGERAVAAAQRIDLFAQPGHLRRERRDRLLDPSERFLGHGSLHASPDGAGSLKPTRCAVPRASPGPGVPRETAVA